MNALILIDVGNTRLKWATVTPRGVIKVQGAVPTARVTPRWAASFAKQHAGVCVVAASVVPAVSTLLRCALPAITLVGGTLRGLPLTFAYLNPAEIGADRIAAAIGAGSSAPAIILNCGTATAFGVLDRRGRFAGGAIMPGMDTQLRALASRTAQLPLANLAATPRALGKSTSAAIRAGVVFGWQGGVAEIVARLRREMGRSARVIVTGGEAQHLRGARGLANAEFRPLLVFEGLRIIANALHERAS